MIAKSAVVIALVLAPAAVAQTYIVPTQDCGNVTLKVSRGSDFPNAGAPVMNDEVADGVVWNKQRTRIKPADDSRPFSISLTTEVSTGVHAPVFAAGVNLKPRVVGNETRTEHAKTLLFCGDTPMADWQGSVGQSFEIFPQEWNPLRTRMKAGDRMWFIAVDETQTSSGSKLIHDQPMQLFKAGTGLVQEGKANKIGGMDFRFPEPGLYMVVATHRRADPEHADHFLVDTSTLTFEVK